METSVKQGRAKKIKARGLELVGGFFGHQIRFELKHQCALFLKYWIFFPWWFSGFSILFSVFWVRNWPKGYHSECTRIPWTPVKRLLFCLKMWLLVFCKKIKWLWKDVSWWGWWNPCILLFCFFFCSYSHDECRAKKISIDVWYIVQKRLKAHIVSSFLSKNEIQ